MSERSCLQMRTKRRCPIILATPLEADSDCVRADKDCRVCDVMKLLKTQIGVKLARKRVLS